MTYVFPTEKGTAKRRKDFRPKDGMVTFDPGETVEKIKVKTREDRRHEKKETFFLSVSSAAGPADQAKGKIKDED